MLQCFVILFTLLHLALSFQPENVDGTSALARTALREQGAYASSERKSQSCHSPVVRREWSELSVDDRKQWIAAVNCLMDKPAISGDLAPGARSRYDDFLGTHINQTLTIHFTGNFLFWHRYYLKTFETALREECKYQGYQPYANWGKYAQNPIDSPVFDGSASSIGSNGVFSPRLTTIQVPPWAGPNDPHLELPTNLLGGGCIASGPFSTRQAHLGPVTFSLSDLPRNPRPDGLGYNPRCLRRELSAYVSSRLVTDRNATDLLLQSADILAFQARLEGALGVHTGGHTLLGANPGQNLYESPADPHFWLHHAYVDRLWWVWQNQRPAVRRDGIGFTRTFQNEPPSAASTLDDLMDIGVNAGPRTLRSVTSTLEDGLCYVYS